MYLHCRGRPPASLCTASAYRPSSIRPGRNCRAETEEHRRVERRQHHNELAGGALWENYCFCKCQPSCSTGRAGGRGIGSRPVLHVQQIFGGAQDVQDVIRDPTTTAANHRRWLLSSCTPPPLPLSANSLPTPSIHLQAFNTGRLPQYANQELAATN